MKNSFKKLLLAPLFLLTICCTTNKKKEFKHPELSYSSEAIRTGTLKIPLDSVTPNRPVAFQTLRQNGADYFTFINHYTNSLYYFNLKTKTYDKVVQFAKDGPNGIGKFDNTTEYEFMGDSIMFYSRSSLQLTIVNGQNEVVFKHNFAEQGQTAPYGMTRGWAFRTKDGFNFSSVVQTPYVELNDLPDSLAFDFSLQDKTVKKVYSPLPEAYRGEMWMLEQLRYHRAASEKLRVYSYPIDQHMQYRTASGEFKSKYFGTKSMQPIEPIAGIEVAQDMQSSGQYYFGQGRYSSVYYDPYRKLFLRAAYSGMNKEAVNINKPYGDTTKFDKLFVIGDEQLNVIGELQNDKMLAHITFFQPNGIYVLEETDDEDHLTFAIYDIVEKKAQWSHILLF